MKIALIVDAPPTECNSFYLKIEDVRAAAEATALAKLLENKLHELYNMRGKESYQSYFSGAFIAEKIMGIRVARFIYTEPLKPGDPSQEMDIDVLNHTLKECGYILRTVFDSKYSINRKQVTDEDYTTDIERTQ